MTEMKNGFISIFGHYEGFTYYPEDGQDGDESVTKTVDEVLGEKT